MKRLLAAAAMLALIGCHKSGEKAESLAQCRLKAFSPAGMAYQKNLAAKAVAQANATSSPEVDDMAYRDFVEACMQERGFKLIPMYFNNNPGNTPGGCWIDDGKAIFPKSDADDADCYEAQ